MLTITILQLSSVSRQRSKRHAGSVPMKVRVTQKYYDKAGAGVAVKLTEQSQLVSYKAGEEVRVIVSSVNIYSGRE